jgi:ubiquinone/menaquinone biosynthesis C-methylase UbiE
MKLDAEQLEAARAALLGDQAELIICFMAGQSVLPNGAVSSNVAKETAWNAGWLIPQTETRTTLGFIVNDSCREYLFWRERNKELPFENSLPHLSDSLFEGKYVAEVGSGMGANLMSLAHRTRRFCGVEPVEAYLQLGEIFCAREGIKALDSRVGRAEALPFKDGEVDLVLCVTAHQYFDIIPAFREFARVLKPGGELVVIGGTFSNYARRTMGNMLNPTERKAATITLVNSMSYMALGRRLIGSRNRFSTSRPVYPTSAAMIRWMRGVGFTQVTPPDRIKEETCFYAKLPD